MFGSITRILASLQRSAVLVVLDSRGNGDFRVQTTQLQGLPVVESQDVKLFERRECAGKILDVDLWCGASQQPVCGGQPLRLSLPDYLDVAAGVWLSARIVTVQ